MSTEKLRVEHAALTTKVARLTALCDRFATLSSQDQDHAVKAITERNAALRTLAERDATIEAMQTQLNEATNKPEPVTFIDPEQWPAQWDQAAEPTLARLANELEDAQRCYRDAFNRRAS